MLCVWHSIIAAVIFYLEPIEQLEPTNLFVLIDRYVFAGLFIIYIIMNIILLIWLVQVPYRRRREMERCDREYRANRHAQSSAGQSRFGSKQNLVFRRSSSVFDSAAILKFPRGIRQSDSGIIIPNGSTFIPIQEVSNESTSKAMNMIELREQDDK